MSARRRTRRSAGAGARAVMLLAFLLAVAVLLGLMVNILSGQDEVAETAAILPTETPTPEPTETPEPTPALPAVDINDWSLRLVRDTHPLGEDFVPESLTEIEEGEQMDSRAAPALKTLIADARAAGYTVYVCSCYRDYNTQSGIYWTHIDNYTAQGMTFEQADAATRLAVNYPGCSEHQSGLAADILESRDQDMEPYIGGSGLMLWLEEHCADYGFVIRYPEDKTDVTGIEYEPWHLRYVGTAARYIMEHGLCLEEFLDLYNQ